MLLRYIGQGEPVPELGGMRAENGAIYDVKNERLARLLLKTLRWVKPDAKKRVPRVETLSIKTERPPDKKQGVEDDK